MSNTSATGGYLTPVTDPLPGSLTLTQFLQTVLVGISGLDGAMCRPKWQVNPPKMPDIDQNWIAFQVARQTPDANAYVWLDSAGVNQTQRHEELEIAVSLYGPESQDYAGIMRDGFQITQNLEALNLAGFGFKGTSDAINSPDLVNERWVPRYEMSIFIRREVRRAYPILSILSVNGRIHTVLGNEEYLLAWGTD